MRSSCWTLALAAFLATSCVGVSAPSRDEVRQAVAPTGKLRLGMVLAANHATRDAATGELRGIAVDLGREAARRIDVPFEAVPYASFDALWAGMKSAQWDMAAMGVTPERAAEVDFTPPYMTVEYTFLVPAGSPLTSPTDVDRPGMKIGVLKLSAPDQYLSQAMKQAQVVRSTTVVEMVDSFRTGRAGALFGSRIGMLNQVSKLPGSKVLDGAFGGEGTAIAVPKGRPLVADYARSFVERVKSDGFAKRVIDKAALPGIVAAP